MSRRVARLVRLGLLAAALLAAPAQAATITVNAELDVVSSSDGLCSLREAIIAASSGQPSGPAAGECAAGEPGLDTVDVPAGLYPVGAELVVPTDLVLTGAQAGETVLDGGGSGRVVRVVGPPMGSGTELTLRHVTITNGVAPAGGPGGDATAGDGGPGLAGGSATGGTGGTGASGGAIVNQDSGTLVLEHVRLIANRAGAGGAGGDALGGRGGNAAGDGVCGVGGAATAGAGGRGGWGGGLYSVGPVIVRDSLVAENQAGLGNSGGEAFGGNGGTGGTSSQAGCDGGVGTGGDGGLGGWGGGIASEGAVIIERSVLRDNRAGEGGLGYRGFGGEGGTGGTPGGSGGDGAAGNGGDGGSGGSGGAVVLVALPGSEPPIAVTASTFEGNAAGDGGDGGLGDAGRGGNGGGTTFGTGWFGGEGHGGNGGSGGHGGAVRAADGATTFASTLFSANRSGAGGTGGQGLGGDGGTAAADGNANIGGNGLGGVGGAGGGGAAAWLSGGTSIADSTVAGNTAGRGGAGGSGGGGRGGNAPGGLAGSGGSGDGADGGPAGDASLRAGTNALVVRGTTIAGNAAEGGGAGGDGFPGGAGTGETPGSQGGGGDGAGGAAAATGGLLRTIGPITLTNTIVAANTPANCAGTVSGGSGVIRFGDETCPGTTADPLLGALADNGGPSRTLAPEAGSPAFGFGTTDCTTADQRGAPRATPCDAGAYEAVAPTAITGATSAVSETGATVAGVMTPYFGAPSYRFEYGPTVAYGQSTEAFALDGGLTAREVSATVGGLAPGTTYHYRLVAANADGTTMGADATFTTAGPPGGGADTTAPAFTAASLSPKRFRVDRKGATEAPLSAAKKGTRFAFSLSEPARVVFAIQRARPGRRVKGRCVKPTSRNRALRKCTRWKLVGRFAMQAPAGASTKRFSGRIGAKRLKPGRHRAVLVATDAAGNASAPMRLKFRVVRR